MYFLVISTPGPSRPSELNNSRSAFWDWVDRLRAQGHLACVYSRVGRGVVAIFNVESTELLHRYLNEWTDFVPATFEVHALIEQAAAKSYLASRE